MIANVCKSLREGTSLREMRQRATGGYLNAYRFLDLICQTAPCVSESVIQMTISLFSFNFLLPLGEFMHMN